MNARLLYLDDEPDACEAASGILRARGYEVVTETRVDAAIERAVQEDFDAVLVDLRMEELDGLAVCERLLAAKPSLPVVVVTGHTSTDAVLGALRAGAYDFVAKPFKPPGLLFAAVERATQSSRLREEVRRLRASADSAARLGTIIGESPAMQAVYAMIARVAPSTSTVLITGESGTGKELLAREIHARSDRAAGPFVAINCAAMPAQLLESELFGHERGAFTDAKSARRGLFLEAQGGTLFLDEIGEMPLEMQAKLLRALQERTVRPVGASHEIAFDARLVAATARDLHIERAEGRFRADLFYRIHVCAIVVPPLCVRGGDIALLAQRFTERFAARQSKAVSGFTAETLRKLLLYPWPGNVRELENCIERAVTMTATEQLVPADLPSGILDYRRGVVAGLLPESLEAVVTMDEMERLYTEHVLGLVHGNKAHAARLLGYDRRTIYRKLEPAKVRAPHTTKGSA